MSKTENTWAFIIAIGLIFGAAAGILLFVFTHQILYIHIGSGL
ncbi:MAG: hypothetical protein QCH99_08580 [Candidatus Bathyarchaeota archaeon]|nr:hypothetical protein [Candidatus Bathyarchaeum tardum]WGM89929.1 MAG: hypothetical protein NUK63_02070 [Candidatus Bathyarchaeum tardum]